MKTKKCSHCNISPGGMHFKNCPVITDGNLELVEHCGAHPLEYWKNCANCVIRNTPSTPQESKCCDCVNKKPDCNEELGVCCQCECHPTKDIGEECISAVGIAEKIVIEYANITGREDIYRPFVRLAATKILEQELPNLLSHLRLTVIEEAINVVPREMLMACMPGDTDKLIWKEGYNKCREATLSSLESLKAQK